jgi:prolipoprotein diacylglyceryltransferase
MERIAFLWQGTGRPVYWDTIFLLLGALTALLFLIVFRALGGAKLWPLLPAVPLAAAAAVYAARLVHWYCCTEDYPGLAAALSDLETGSFSLAGALMGGTAAIALLGLIRLISDLPAFLDDAAAAASAGIAAGRLGGLFSLSDHGKMIFEDAAEQALPVASPVYDAVSGTYEWRFATFCFQSIWAGAIFLILVLVLACRRAGKGRARPGSAFTLFLTLYCLGQILLDSTRYDALFLRSNGFVSMEQILCCAVLLTILAAAGRRAAKDGGFSAVHAGSLLLFLAGLGLAGYMEYYVQRHGGAYVKAYSLMAAGLTLTFAAMRWMERKSRPKE